MTELPAPDQQATARPLSPYHEHSECGFHWHGRDGMDIPMRDGQPVCPRCELTKTEKKVTALQRRRDEVGAECKRRGKRVLEQSEQILALERQLDEVRNQLGAEILRAGQAEVELRHLAGETQQDPAPGGEAHPPHDSWLVEWRAKGGDWEVAYPTHDHSKALHRLERGRQDASDWQWRLVRETTSYAVDAAESSGQPDTNQEDAHGAEPDGR